MLARAALSVVDYLVFEQEADRKHEFWFGHIVAMAGASPAHNILALNVGSELRQRLRKRGCITYTADQRVKLPEGNYAYPDVSVVCGEPRYSDERPASLINPVLLVEVVSDSTAEMDRRTKLEAYTHIESLQAYWIVEQDEPLITHYERRGDSWTVHFTRGLEATVHSDAVALALPMAELYDQVPLETAAEPTDNGES